MRDIKFRVYKPVHGDDEAPVMTMPFTMGNLQDQEGFEFTNGMYSNWDEFGLEHEDAVIMQFTGLKDKSGVDIYEGDIVKIRNDSHKIIWESYFAQFNIENLISGITADIYRDVFAEEALVIGNIHQNPELLENNDE